MYKFTNGIVIYDEKTKKAYLKAGMKLVENDKQKQSKKGNIKTINEDSTNNGTIKEKPRRSNKKS